MCDCGGAKHLLPVPRASSHYDITVCSVLQHLCDCGGAEHPLPVPADPRDGALGAAGLHPHPAQAPRHEPTTPGQSVSVSP
jgi:hypothetical protein